MFAPFIQPRQLQGEALQIEAIAREQPEADSEHTQALFQRCLA
ncbi:hypothetical protein [Paucibacter sp. DJ2R-2]|nr:hypothetical protein [Paucibacter sp. DJ2R-2]